MLQKQSVFLQKQSVQIHIHVTSFLRRVKTNLIWALISGISSRGSCEGQRARSPSRTQNTGTYV